MNRKIRILPNLVFGQTDKENLTADVYLPLKGENLPVILLIHGGSWQSGSKEMYSEWGPFLAEQGFATIAINYRLSTPFYSTWPGVLDDISMAVNWVVSRAYEWKIEPQRLGFIGDSSGAHLASLFSLVFSNNASYKIRAVIGVYGGYDLVKRRDQSIITGRKDLPVDKFMGCTPEEAQEEYILASPIYRIKEAVSNPTFDTRYFLIWGEADQVVPPTISEAFASKLKEAGIHVETHVIPDYGHFWFNLLPGVPGGTLNDYPNTEVAPLVLEFMKKELCSDVIGNFSPKQIQKLLDSAQSR